MTYPPPPPGVPIPPAPTGSPNHSFAPASSPIPPMPHQPAVNEGVPNAGQYAPPAPGYIPPTTTADGQPLPEFTQRSTELKNKLVAVRQEVAKAVVGQDSAVTSLLIGLLCQGHVLLEGVPGVAKTLMVRSLAEALQLETKRVQFTPDLMPGDVTGSLVFNSKEEDFVFRPGPVFTNLLLADEINRTPPKTQSSLLEAMEERQVTVDGNPLPLPNPFLVIATQNPIEYEGTYTLPEAQLDRFLMKIVLHLPERNQEVEVLNRHARGFSPRNLAAAGLQAVATAEDLAAAREEIQNVLITEQIIGYIVDICRATRQSPSLALGVSPRGSTALMNTTRAWAWLNGRYYVTPDDVKAHAVSTLRHRVRMHAEAQMEGVNVESIIQSILSAVPVPR